jgi:peptide/nickel transport system ATP-binding protein
MKLSELLRIRDLVVHFHTDYGVVEAIDRCAFAVDKGEVVGLIGESGCGKTTTARAILGIIPSPPGKIVGGEIIFQGQDLLKMDQQKVSRLIRGQAITLIPQDPFTSLNPLFPVGTQIMDILRWKTEKRSKEVHREKVVKILKQMQIPSPDRQLGKYPHEFSGGQRQRLMIAMALLPNPSLIIADEPTTALVVTIEAQILHLLRQLVKEYGLSVLYITHDLGVASQICDRVIIMYAGQVMENAPIASFFAKPLHPYTRKLLQSLPQPDGRISDIPGEVPNLVHPPGGCRFQTRCDYAGRECMERPLPEEKFPGHWVSCFHPLLEPAQGPDHVTS